MIIEEIKAICIRVWRYVRKWIEEDIWSIDVEDMKGACAIASYTLFLYLKNKGYNAKFVMAMDKDDYEGHCYVELNDLVLDLTPKQFDENLPDILIVKKQKYVDYVPKVKEYIRVTRGKRAISQLKEWVVDQNPLIYHDKINYLISKTT